MSGSKGAKRISVFDRLGPGNDESGSVHRRYSSEKHAGTSSGQEKSRSHTYTPSASSSHIRLDERETPPIRDRKSRHRNEFPNVSEPESLEEKRPSNPPPVKSSETLKSVGVKVPRPLGSMGPGDSDYDSSEEGKRRKGYRGDHDTAHRGKHGSEPAEDDRRSRGKEKGHTHPDRPGSSASRHRSPPAAADAGAAKTRSRRDPVSTSHDHKRRKEDEGKTSSSELGHKRKREHSDEVHLPDMKRARHAEHGSGGGGSTSSSSRDTDRHGKEADCSHGKWRQDAGGSESSSRRQHRSRSPRTPVSGVGGDKERGRSTGKGGKYTTSSSSSSRDSGKKPSDKDPGKTAEGAKKSKGLDWSAISDFTEKANSKLSYHPSKSVLGKFTPAAVLMGVEVSPELAGPALFHKIVELIRAHSKTVDETDVTGFWADILEGQESASTPRTPAKTTSNNWDKAVSKSLGGCRRALTASDDYTLRRLLRKDRHRSFITPVRPTPNTWTTGHYEIALEFYQSLPTKPSGKPAQKFQASKVGTLVL